MAETDEFSSVMRRTVEVVRPLSTIWPMTPFEAVTGMPTPTPEEVPRLMETVEVHESEDPEMMRAPVDCRL